MKTIIAAMGIDRQNIHQDCREQFVCVSEFTGYGAQDIELAGISELRREYQIGRENLGYHHIIFTIKGAGSLSYADSKQPIPAHTMTWLPAGSCFFYELAEEEWHTCWFLLKDSLMWRQLRSLPGGIYPCQLGELVRASLSLLSRHHSIYAGQEPKKEAELMAILTFYLNEALSGVQQVDGHAVRLQAFFNDVKGQLHLPWTTKLIAEQLHVSEPHLFRICQQALGKSPMQCLLELRLQHACELLKHTRLSLEQVAHSVGYQDAGSFSQRFKKHFSVAPGQWRKQV